MNATPSSEPIQEYKFMGNYVVRLYPNRLHITQKLLGMNLYAVNETIPLRSIIKIEMPLGKRMEITTTGGKKYTLNLTPKQAEDLKARIEELL